MGNIGPGELLILALPVLLTLSLIFAGGFVAGYFAGKGRGYREGIREARSKHT